VLEEGSRARWGIRDADPGTRAAAKGALFAEPSGADESGVNLTALLRRLRKTVAR